MPGNCNKYIIKCINDCHDNYMRVLNLRGISNEKIQKFIKERDIYLNDLNHVDEERVIYISSYEIMLLITPYCYETISVKNFISYQYKNRYNILKDVINDLISLDNCGLYHGCLNPNNITIHSINEYKDIYKLCNYGLNPIIKHTSDLCYNEISYLSPEVILCKESDIKSDIWSFGCVYYYLLTGKSLFHAINIRSLTIKIIKCNYQIGINECSKEEKLFIEKLVTKRENRENIKKVKIEIENMKEIIFDNITLKYIDEMANENIPIIEDEKLTIICQTNGLLNEIIKKYNDLDDNEEKKYYYFGLLMNLSFNILCNDKIIKNIEVKPCLKTIFDSLKCQSYINDKYIIPSITINLSNINKLKTIQIFSKILPELSKLQMLVIKGDGYTKIKSDVVLKYLSSSFDNLKILDNLIIKSLELSKDSIKILSDILSSNKMKLSILHIEDNKISDIGISYLLSKACDINKLTELYICNNEISSFGLECISKSLKYLKHLNILTVSNSKEITEMSFKHFVNGLKKCEYIEILILRKLSINDKMLNYLIEAMSQNSFKYLETLFLNENDISEKGLENILNCIGKSRESSCCRRLELLDVNNNKKLKNKNVKEKVFGTDKMWYMIFY